MAFFSERIAKVQKSGIREIFDLAETLPDYINLGIGEPDFKTPAFIRNKMKASVDSGFSRYTTNAGIFELRDAIARKLKNENGIDVDPASQVIVTSGGTQAIFVLMNCLLNPGDEVILPTPLFTAYKYAVRLAGGVPVEVPMDEIDGFALDVRRLERKISKKSKLLVINSPGNPTGAVYSKDSIVEACSLATENGLYVVSDEIYENFIFAGAGHFSAASISEFRDKVITINGFSKKYSMTGWRIGYAVANASIIRAMTLYNMYNAVCASSFVQIAALEALKHSQAFFAPILRRYDARRRLVCDGLETLGLEFKEPRGAFYVFPALTGVRMDSLAFCKGLLLKYRVSTVPGSDFGEGGENHIRISYSLNEKELSLALSRIGKYLNDVRKK